ncbi:MAG: haloacid dehalogenase type II [Proteobacteria bacterium]|nr:haloacid dehalogenase type II [Pseudomonadota bacterium]
MLGLGKPPRPRVVAFDVIGTLFPIAPLQPAVERLGLPAAAVRGWFAAGLRDSFALAATGGFKPLLAVLEQALEAVLAEHGVEDASAQDKAALLTGLEHLPPRPDSAAAFGALAGAGIGVMVLTNGSDPSTRKLLGGAGLEGLVDHVVSVEAVELSKPRREAYAHAAQVAGVGLDAMALVAAHSWDIQGANAAGMTTAYLNVERPFSKVMRKPDLEGGSLSELAEALAALKT